MIDVQRSKNLHARSGESESLSSMIHSSMMEINLLEIDILTVRRRTMRGIRVSTIRRQSWIPGNPLVRIDERVVTVIVNSRDDYSFPALSIFRHT